MSASECFELAKIGGSIVAVWFGLVGWKLFHTSTDRG